MHEGIATAAFGTQAAGNVNKLTHDFVNLRGVSTTMPDLSTEVNWHIRNAWESFLVFILELYDQLDTPRELKILILQAELLETVMYGCVLRSPCTCPYNALRPEFTTAAWPTAWDGKIFSPYPPDVLFDILVKTRSKSTEATF